jgi:putative peptidoglycan lipid II flippase
MKANRQIARAAGIVSMAVILSQVLGLVRQILMSHAFGTGLEADAFNAATQYSDVIFNLAAGGALASAFIPTFSSLLADDDHREAWKLASSITNLALILLSALAVLSTIFAPQIVSIVLAPKFSPEKQALTVQILRVVLPSAVIFGVSGLLMGVINAHQSFLLPALAPSAYWLGMIVGIVWLSPSMGIFGPAWGVMIGASLHLIIQIPALLRLPQRRYWPTLGLKIPQVVEVGRLMGPRLFGVAVGQLNFLVNTNLASGMSDGSLTSIKVAFMVMTTPLYVIASSIGTASLPTFSAQIARGRYDEMSGSLTAALRGVFLLALPASLGLVLLRTPLVGFLFETGRFTSVSTEMVAWALLWYAAGLIGHSVLEVVYRAFYSLKNTITPVLVGAAAMGLNIGFSFLFTGLFSRIGWAPYGGLALANSLATFIEMLTAFFLLRRSLPVWDSPALAAGAGQSVLGTLLMSAGLWGWLAASSALPHWLVTLGGVGIGLAVYTAALAAMRVPELKVVISWVSGRFLKSGEKQK